MTLEAVYYVTQIIAVGAIFVSLVAIWFQMRQSAKMERAAAQREDPLGAGLSSPGLLTVHRTEQ